MAGRLQFTVDLERFRRRLRAGYDEVVNYTVLAVGKSVVYKSPVGDPTKWKSPPPPGYVGGRFRNSWQHGIGSIPATEEFRPDAGGSGSISRITEGARQGAGHVHYIVNGVPYARALEYGHSTQAPGTHAIVGRTLQEFEQYVRDAVREVK